jgi:hypothetical protein
VHKAQGDRPVGGALDTKLDLNRLVDAAETLTILPRRSRWVHLSLCVLDAVYSIGQGYDTQVAKLCHRYADIAGLKNRACSMDLAGAVIGTEQEQPLHVFRDWADSHEPDGLAAMLGSRNRTSRRRTASLKTVAVQQYARILVTYDVDTIGKAAELLGDEDRLEAVERELAWASGSGGAQEFLAAG